MRTQSAPCSASYARLISSLLLLLILVSGLLATGCTGRGSLNATNDTDDTDTQNGDFVDQQADEGADEYVDLDQEYFDTGNNYGNTGNTTFQPNQVSSQQQACFGGFNNMFQGGQYGGGQYDDYGVRSVGQQQGNYCLDPRTTGTSQSLTRNEFYDVGLEFYDNNLGCLLRGLAFQPRTDAEAQMATLYGVIGVIECISQHSVGQMRQELPWTTDQYGYFDRTQYNLNVFAHILR